MNNKIKELVDLCFDVISQTDAYVSITISNYGCLCNVYIMDEGFDLEKPFDGEYMVWIDDILLKDSNENLLKAKKHLERLIADSKKKENMAV